MVNPTKSRLTLNNNVKMPRLGLGVYKAKEGGEVERAVEYALSVGYRLIDTAYIYFNESGVGTAVNNSKIPREELFITTKLWNDRHGYEEALKAFEESRRNLKLDYIDLYLIHWPCGGKLLETWKALEKLYDEGVVKAIGVSNYLEHHLDEILTKANIPPAVNQVEFHPYFWQESLYYYCNNNDIVIEAWAPLARGNVLNDRIIVEIASKHNKKTSQVVLRWQLQKNIVTIPKSVNPERIKENAEIFDFELDDEDMLRIDNLNEGEKGRIGSYPK
ncbi:MAG: aldo/keto reductase [Deferribacterota bacterium]|nr:aldo/keto reductase [Deferribacterota bacterium]